MSAGKRRLLRSIALIIWLALALFVAGTALAQDGGTPPPEGGAVQTAGQPESLNEIAARLAPLLVGAALIERTLEFLFNWVERAVMDITSRFNDLALRLTRLVQVDLHQAWDQLGALTNAALTRQLEGVPEDEGDPASDDPQDWPLAMLEQKLTEAKDSLAKAQSTLQSAMKSPMYTTRKKMAASWMSLIFGIFLAAIGSLRLFEPLGVEVKGWFDGPFNVLDMIMAGILMGLGTDWVHQVIGVIIQGKGFLGRAGGGGQVDVNALRAQSQTAVENAFQDQLDRFRAEIEERLRDAGPRPPSTPT